MEVRADANGASGRVVEAALHKESASFLSTHLLRELIAADARGDGASDETAARADALLGAILAGLELTEGAIVRIEPDGRGTCLAVRGVPDHAREVLEARAARSEQLGPSLLARALDERRETGKFVQRQPAGVRRHVHDGSGLRAPRYTPDASAH